MTANLRTAVNMPNPTEKLPIINPIPLEEDLESDHCFDAVVSIINETFNAQKDFKKTSGVSHRKYNAIENLIEHGIQAPMSTFETKLNALHELTSISLVIIECFATRFERETRKRQVFRDITNTMAEIMSDMDRNAHISPKNWKQH